VLEQWRHRRVLAAVERAKDIRWIIKHKQEGIDAVEIATLLKDYQQKVLQAHVEAIKAAHTERKEQNSGKSGPTSAST
jgi:hypothetical protein